MNADQLRRERYGDYRHLTATPVAPRPATPTADLSQEIRRRQEWLADGMPDRRNR